MLLCNNSSKTEWNQRRYMRKQHKFQTVFSFCQHTNQMLVVGTKTTISVVHKLLPIVPFKSSGGNMQTKQSTLIV